MRCIVCFAAVSKGSIQSCCLRAAMGVLQKDQWRAVAYLVTNLASGTSIVFANKLVLSILGFHYVRPLLLSIPRFTCS